MQNPTLNNLNKSEVESQVLGGQSLGSLPIYICQITFTSMFEYILSMHRLPHFVARQKLLRSLLGYVVYAHNQKE